ncbi:MAG: hypothetical protein ACR652_13605 [Methylocystis sp.]|uniref:hypothetical protein n=1 Tax=Methylocystis sp. TaxID=1911079 RepID=UPI003DA4068B
MGIQDSCAATFPLPPGPATRPGAAHPLAPIDVRAATERLDVAAKGGDPLAILTLALSREARGALPAALDGCACTDATTLYDAASAQFEAGRVGAAVCLLTPLLLEDGLEPDPLLALAVCAARLERLDAALFYAEQAIFRGCRHPRAFCLAGLGALNCGDRNVALDRLALAARLARRSAAYRGDLRAAQRLLLSLHFD